MIATINHKEIKVEYSIRPDVGREFLRIDCPNGWDDVEKINKKILTYQGKKFSFTGWNSDRNEAYFAKPIDKDCEYASID